MAAPRKKGRKKRKKRAKNTRGRFLFFLVFAGALATGLFWWASRHGTIPDEATPTAPHPVQSKRAFSHLPKLTFVIDDIGYHLDLEQDLRGLGSKVTYSVLPLLPYSKYFGNLSRATGAEVILHLPLETVSGTIPGRGLITGRMDKNTVLETLRRNLASVPYHVGANNHMGSLGTRDAALMTILLREMKQRRLFFLDSYTTGDSIARATGKSVGIPVLRRDIFLDNIDNETAIVQQLAKLKTLARKKGYGIGIGHYRKNTLRVLSEQIPRLEREGFEIISLSDLVKFVSSANGLPSKRAPS